MKTKAQKWGNSLAVRIPKSFADEIHLAPDSLVDNSVRNSQIVTAPPAPNYTLEELLSGITAENLHGEIDFGPPVGNEIIE